MIQLLPIIGLHTVHRYGNLVYAHSFSMIISFGISHGQFILLLPLTHVNIPFLTVKYLLNSLYLNFKGIIFRWSLQHLVFRSTCLVVSTFYKLHLDLK